MKQPDSSQILKQCAHGVIGTDSRGSIVHINDKAKEIIRYDGLKPKGENVVDVLPVTGQLILEAMEKKNPISVTRWKESRKTWLSASMS